MEESFSSYVSEFLEKNHIETAGSYSFDVKGCELSIRTVENGEGEIIPDYINYSVKVGAISSDMLAGTEEMRYSFNDGGKTYVSRKQICFDRTLTGITAEYNSNGDLTAAYAFKAKMEYLENSKSENAANLAENVFLSVEEKNVSDIVYFDGAFQPKDDDSRWTDVSIKPEDEGFYVTVTSRTTEKTGDFGIPFHIESMEDTLRQLLDE